MARTPTRSEVERAWTMRQYQLDEEAGKEPDPLEYSREFRNFWKAETNAAYERGRRAVLRKEPVQRHNHVTRDIEPCGQCPSSDATEQTGGELAACLEVRAYWRNVAIRELTEAIRFTVEYTGNDMLPAIEGWDWYDALVKYVPEVAQAFVDKPIHFPKPTDAALAVLERIRQAVSGHPECDRYEEGDVISCGWKSAYASVVAALVEAPEPEWEYGWMADEARRSTMSPRGPRLLIDGLPHSPEEIARFPRGQRVRRVKAGPWLPVEGERESDE